MEGLIEGAILAVFVVLLFLRDIRATAISALAIPLSAIPAFWFMSMMGITMNFMSTMAMGLVAGVLVDDAIVEIENIVRHMRMGKSAYQASLDAADEIGLAVLATTMAIVAVFLPVALMPGIAGQYFKAFGFTVVVSVLMSLLVARMITPLIAAYFLRSHGVQPHAAWKWMDIYLKVLNWSLDTSRPMPCWRGCPSPPQVRLLCARALLLLLVVAPSSPAPARDDAARQARHARRDRFVIASARRASRTARPSSSPVVSMSGAAFANGTGSSSRAGTRACTTTGWRWSARAS